MRHAMIDPFQNLHLSIVNGQVQIAGLYSKDGRSGNTFFVGDKEIDLPKDWSKFDKRSNNIYTRSDSTLSSLFDENGNEEIYIDESGNLINRGFSKNYGSEISLGAFIFKRTETKQYINDTKTDKEYEIISDATYDWKDIVCINDIRDNEGKITAFLIFNNDTQKFFAVERRGNIFFKKDDFE
ncbi:MAG: hypothetical protein HQL29_06730, partial [Candidatus Omnitrophica bacterium]|nr:hypothetical protein [Candidatus Omnitrophota bacterium]